MAPEVIGKSENVPSELDALVKISPKIAEGMPVFLSLLRITCKRTELNYKVMDRLLKGFNCFAPPDSKIS